MIRRRYQRGTMSRVKRVGGDVFVYRWRETGMDGQRHPRSRVVGTVKDLRTVTAAWQKLEELNISPNVDLSGKSGAPATFGELVAVYREQELTKDAFATQQAYTSYLDNWILPKWREQSLHRMEQTPGKLFEAWLQSLSKPRANDR